MNKILFVLMSVFLPLLLSGTSAAQITPGPEIHQVVSCSQGQHDQWYGKVEYYGETYATWMPQIDYRNNYECHYGHEHGTNPAIMFPSGWRPAYGVASIAENGSAMFHEGYKGVGFFSGDYAWYFTIHQGSSGQGATCARYHDFGVYVENYLTGEKMAEVYYLADFGRSEQNVGNVPLTPDDCPNQGVDDLGGGTDPISGEPMHRGRRLFGTISSGAQNYSPWAIADYYTVFGFNADQFTGWADPMYMCNDLNCTDWVINPNDDDSAGTKRLVSYGGRGDFGFTYKSDWLVTGDFCTDPYASEVIDCTESNAVHQYVNPSIIGKGLRPEIASTKCHQRSGYDMLYMCMPYNSDDPAANQTPFDAWAWSEYNLLNGIGNSN